MAKITTNLTDTINQWLTNHNSLSNKVGDLTLLNTTVDSDIVGAINSLYAGAAFDSDITSLQTQITNNDSDITSLQTQITNNDSDIAGNTSSISSLSSSLSGYLRSNVADSKTSGNLTFNDNIVAQFGTGADLQIYHDGSNSYITDAGTGSLIIGGTINFPNDINLTAGASNWTFTVVSNNLIIKYGATSLAKLDTSGNLTVTGDINTNGTI